MDIYRAQRQLRPLASDVTGTDAPNDNWGHPTKGVMIYNLNPTTTLGGGIGVDVHIKGATSGITFAFTMIVTCGVPLILPFRAFGASTIGQNHTTRGIVGLY
jgi:hypothetical protein